MRRALPSWPRRLRAEDSARPGASANLAIARVTSDPTALQSALSAPLRRSENRLAHEAAERAIKRAPESFDSRSRATPMWGSPGFDLGFDRHARPTIQTRRPPPSRPRLRRDGSRYSAPAASSASAHRRTERPVAAIRAGEKGEVSTFARSRRGGRRGGREGAPAARCGSRLTRELLHRRTTGPASRAPDAQGSHPRAAAGHGHGCTRRVTTTPCPRRRARRCSPRG